jgi:hypothetical protein
MSRKPKLYRRLVISMVLAVPMCSAFNRVAIPFYAAHLSLLGVFCFSTVHGLLIGLLAARLAGMICDWMDDNDDWPDRFKRWAKRLGAGLFPAPTWGGQRA